MLSILKYLIVLYTQKSWAESYIDYSRHAESRFRFFKYKPSHVMSVADVEAPSHLLLAILNVPQQSRFNASQLHVQLRQDGHRA